MTVSIIIVNYNVFGILKNCLNSIYRKFKEFEFEIIVVDNNSHERDIDSVNHIFPDVKYLSLKENFGFAKANNIAAKNAAGNYLLFLNPDTLIAENFIPDFIARFKKNQRTGICAPGLVYPDYSFQSSTGPKLGLLYDFLESFMLVDLYRKLTRTKYITGLNKVYKVGWVSGACLFIEKKIFESVGGFTESYFLNYEDIDLCFKILKKDREIFYLPSLKCIHLDHKSFNKDYERLVFTRYSGRLNYIKLNYNIIQRILSRLIFISGLLLKILLVNFSFTSDERKSRRNGYIKSLKLYAGMQNKLK